MRADENRLRRLLLGCAAIVVVFGVLPTHRVLQTVAGEEESLSAVVGHFAVFAVFAVIAALWLLARYPEIGLPRATLVALGMTAALGGGVELMQGPLPYRDMQLSDLATDVAGGVAGLAVLSCVRMRAAWVARRRTG